LLILDTSKRNFKVTSFDQEETERAQQAYENAENETEAGPNVQVVLVSVENLDALRKAYLNYYIDTRDFIAEIRKEIAKSGLF